VTIATAPTLSVVVPVYNEEGNVEPLAAEIGRAVAATGRSYEILFVNDGSRDGTLARLAALARRDPHLRIVDLAGNFGEAAALSAGFATARGEIVVTLDGDGQNNPADIPRLLAALGPGIDVASGRRQRREEPFFSRVLPSRVANGLIARLSGVPVYDCGCGLKAYRRGVLADIQLPRGMNRFLPAILGVDGRRVIEVPTRDRARGSGSSHYGMSRLFIVLRDLLALPLLTRRPLPDWRRQALLAASPWVLAAAAFCAAAAAFVLPTARVELLGTTAALAIAAGGTAAMTFNVTRFMRAQRERVFRVREVLEHEHFSAAGGDRGRGLLGKEPAPDLRQAADGTHRAPLRS